MWLKSWVKTVMESQMVVSRPCRLKGLISVEMVEQRAGLLMLYVWPMLMLLERGMRWRMMLMMCVLWELELRWS